MTHVEPQLLGYQLGVSDDAERVALEAHLAECPPCLALFFATKHRLELAAPTVERPSLAVRDRLRVDVAAAISRGQTRSPLPAGAREPRRRPVRFILVGTAVGAALAASLTLVFWVEHTSPFGAPLPPSKSLIDTGSQPRLARVL